MESSDPGRDLYPSISSFEREIQKMDKEMGELVGKAHQELQQHHFDAAVQAIKAAQAVHEDMVDTTKELEEKKKAVNDIQQQQQQNQQQ